MPSTTRFLLKISNDLIVKKCFHICMFSAFLICIIISFDANIWKYFISNFKNLKKNQNRTCCHYFREFSKKMEIIINFATIFGNSAGEKQESHGRRGFKKNTPCPPISTGIPSILYSPRLQSAWAAACISL